MSSVSGSSCFGLQAGSGPQALLALALLGVIVEPLAVLAAEAALLLDQFHHQLLLIRVDGVGAEVGFRRLDDLQPEVEGHFIR
jgi:hypothetical protein